MNDSDQMINKFCDIVKERSTENNLSFELLYSKGLYGNCISILRQELDSLVRAIYLQNIDDSTVRNSLVYMTLSGEAWRIASPDNKTKLITDRNMVDLANKLNGWSRNVYKFGCAFIHLSDYHNYRNEDVIRTITDSERKDIIEFIRDYHFVQLNYNFKLEDLFPILPSIMSKISQNLICHVDNLLLDEGF